MKNIFEDIDKEKVENASEIPQRIDLPQPMDEPIKVELLDEPEEVEVKSRPGEKMIVANAKRLSPIPEFDGQIILGKSLRFNMAKEFSRRDIDFTKVKLTGTNWKIWSVEQDGNLYYQAEWLNANG